ncbi:FAD-binding molybdopterin dehydrogenase [Methylorubrum sp. Q1]|uniref:FAD binding domain-containing protein n=1 Tax=Methylorubrum sp. Q1 TaxID=2562453 RepID=UPI001076A31C|nr:FAD binding domain-containing protein [Methylorubrum sp. Q1]TFZ59048.1 FAD-binding molybdopterin dehydrogenase [Methylorubrum sp. Q1]
MDLDTITAVLRPGSLDALPPWREGDAWLAGGTWLFSEPQPTLARLIDLSALGWPAAELSEAGLRLSATGTIAELDRLDLPKEWIAAPLVGQCCRALLGSFKIWKRASVGGNLCLALPAGPMIALTAALDGTCVLHRPDGSERRLAVIDFVLGPQCTALAPGEILRCIELPATALRRRTAFRRIALSPEGRSGALVIGTRDRGGAFALTVTASTPRPVQFGFDALPTMDALQGVIAAAIPADGWYDDVHGAPDWRRHVTGRLAEEIREELAR